MSKHTPGPWFADPEGRIWRRSPSELYQNGGGVAGDKPLATAHRGWHGEDEVGYPSAANARLIAAAPDLLEALKDAVEYLKPHLPDEALAPHLAAIAKAEGAQ